MRHSDRHRQPQVRLLILGEDPSKCPPEFVEAFNNFGSWISGGKRQNHRLVLPEHDLFVDPKDARRAESLLRMASFGIGALLVTAVFVLAITVNAVVLSSAQRRLMSFPGLQTPRRLLAVLEPEAL